MLHAPAAQSLCASQRWSRARAGAPSLPPRRRASRPAVRAAAWGTDRVEFESVPEAVRERSLRAVESLGGRVTAGDVAARAGLKLTEAEPALRALATDTGATLKVSAQGDLLYVYPTAVRAQLAAKSWRLRYAPALAKARDAGLFAVRVAFGATLLASLAVVYTAITLLLSGRGEDRDRGGRGRGGGGVQLHFGPSLLDFYFWDPFAVQRRREARLRGQADEMGFLESVFSFVFGDGDPNELLEERRWAAVGQLVQRLGGVVTAEQLAPLLEPPPGARGGPAADESFVLPALQRLDGTPEVTAQGQILYRFPQLSLTASRPGRAQAQQPALLSEARWAFSGAPPDKLALAALLGAANAGGVAWLSALLRSPAVMQGASAETLRALGQLLPGLQLYAALFFLVPAGRALLLARRNAGVEARNDARREAARALQQPQPQLQAKLQAAAQRAQSRVFDEQKAVFSSDQDAPDADEGADFERRLKERAAAKKKRADGDGR